MKSEPPFVTVVTRHCAGRGRLLERCVVSLQVQTCDDWVQLVLTDKERRGLPWANQQFIRHKDKICGRYIYILDDDDYLVDPHFLSKAKEIAERHDPDIIMVKMCRAYYDGEILPDKYTWGKCPQLCKVGSPCFLVKRKLWQDHIHIFSDHRCHGDFYFIRRLFDMGCTVYWLDRIVAEVDSIGHPQGI